MKRGDRRAMRWSHAFRYFQNSGSVRIALTSQCGQTCWFCHGEGSAGVAAERELVSRSEAVRLGKWLQGLGAGRLYLSGGEPTLHRDLVGIIDHLVALPNSPAITLATNGSRLAEVARSLAPGTLAKIKLSVHGVRPCKGQEGAKIWSATEIKDLAEESQRIAPVELNVLATRGNMGSVWSILQVAAEVGANVQVLELIWTPRLAARYEDEAVPLGSVTRRLLQDGGQVARVDATTVSGHVSVVRWRGIDVRFFDPRKGVFRGRACRSCAYRAKCIEGLFAIRFDVQLKAMPCLLRKDLSLACDGLVEGGAMEVFCERIDAWVARVVGDGQIEPMGAT